MKLLRLLPLVIVNFACGQISTEVDIDAGGDVGTLHGHTYDGHLEGLELLSGSNRIRITFAEAANGSVYGNVIFGDDPLLSPPSDPHVGYPPGWSGNAQQSLAGPIEHFAFSILNGAQNGSRVTFSIKTDEMWKQWCELQPTAFDGNCLPPGTAGNCSNGEAGTSCCLFPPDGGTVQLDCEYVTLCTFGGPCTCSSTSCSVDLSTNADVAFDLQISGNAVDGSMMSGTKTVIVHATTP